MFTPKFALLLFKTTCLSYFTCNSGVRNLIQVYSLNFSSSFVGIVKDRLSFFNEMKLPVISHTGFSS